MLLSELGLVYCGFYREDEDEVASPTTKKVKILKGTKSSSTAKKPASKAKAK